MTEDLAPIPQPPEKLLLGNVLDLGPQTQVQDLMRLARELGEIFFLQLAGRRLIVVSSFALVDELCDESRFDKRIWAPLHNVREFAGDGLFTAHTFEPNWRLAHRILLPAFSLSAMKGYHSMMADVARQLVERWERLNPRDEIDVADTMTRLTLDTIGLCGFSYRFNSFYRERMHPFVRAMSIAMSIALGRSARPAIPNRLLFREHQRFRRAVELMNEIVDGIVRERRTQAEGERRSDDLLGQMLSGVDRETGERLDDLNIRYQIITFLIAGHETTSGLLSFALYFLIKHPAVLKQAYAEVDRVLGDDSSRDPSYEQVRELTYLRQVLNESLRLWPTAPMFALFPREGETVVGGRYRVTKRDGLAVLVPMLHRDPRVWGSDAEVFDPDRFTPEVETKRPTNSFKPFGNGQRACIGRQFAMHEAALALGMILQRFRLVDHLGYRLEIQETLTLKPKRFKLLVQRRGERSQTSSAAAAEALLPEPVTDEPATLIAPVTTAAALPQHATPLLVLYGSNLGTAEALARRIGSQGEGRGFVSRVAPLDEYVGNLPSEGAVVVVSASYNGAPPDNAARFVGWLEDSELGDDALAGVDFAVFGCGHRDWTATYQRVPTEIDRRLERHGAHRIHRRGEGDGGGDLDADFEGWCGSLWPALETALELEPSSGSGSGEPQTLEPRYRVELLEERVQNPFVESFGARPMGVVENRELQQPGSGRSTRHLELALPPGVSYRTGDHLGVIPHNPNGCVRRVTERFGLDADARVRVEQLHPGRCELPIDQPLSLARLLGEFVELQTPATRAQIQQLAEHTACPPERERLSALCGDDGASRERYRRQILEQHRSPLDLLEETDSCELPFDRYLGMLPALRPRYYSISSSPQCSERTLSITVGVVEGPARCGRGTYHGICSSHLAHREPGSTALAFVRDPGSPFRLPHDPRTPMILVGAGTGLAPFRGFLEERAWQQEQGQDVGPSLLFFGCRHPDHDFLYRDELKGYEERGVVELEVAFSRLDPERKVYVQDRILEQGERVWELLESGGVIYVCGDAAGLAPAVRRAFGELYRARAGAVAVEVGRWLDDLRAADRYLVDVWASS